MTSFFIATTTGLRAVVKALRRVLGKPDRRVFWLKEQYLQLFFEEGHCLAPTMADAIRVSFSYILLQT